MTPPENTKPDMPDEFINIKKAELLSKREFFANSIDGLLAWVEFEKLLDHYKKTADLSPQTAPADAKSSLPEWLETLDYQRDLSMIWMVAKQSKDYDETVGDRIERVQTLILELKNQNEALAATPEPPPQNSAAGDADEALAAALIKIHKLEQRNAYLEDSQTKRTEWLDKAKSDAGYHRNISFDVVWKDALAALRTRLQSPQQGAWQPIETVEPDTEVIFYNAKTHSMCFGEYRPGWIVGEQWRADNNEQTIEKPTHWMPLPEPPDRLERAAKGG